MILMQRSCCTMTLTSSRWLWIRIQNFQNGNSSFSGQQLLEVQKYGNGGEGQNGVCPILNVFSQDGYPGPIEKGFPGIPDSVDAAFLWGGNDRIYFFKVGQVFVHQNLKISGQQLLEV